MASINPNLGIPTNLSVRPSGGATPSVAGEAAAPLPADGLSVDFSKAEASTQRPEAKAVAEPQTPAPPAAAGPAAEAKSGLAQAAADGGLAVSTTGGLAQLEAPPAPEFNASIDGCLAGLCGKSDEIKTITASQVNWDKGADVVSNAQKFVIPVPQFEGGGEPLVYPAGAKDKNGADIGGTPIKDWQGQPIGDNGVVFWNEKDQAWQACKADGNGVVIMNQMTEEQGKKMMDKIGGDPNKLTLQQFKEVLEYANSDEVGCRDMYNSDRDFISKKMNAMETSLTGVPQYGLFRRDDRDVCKALFADGPGEFEAPSGGGVLVKQPIPEEGGILLRQPDGKVFLYRKVDLEVFVDTYKLKDGSQVVLGELPRHQD